MSDRYYTLTIGEEGANTGAYYSVTPDSNLQFAQGGAQFAPTAASAVLVNIYPQTLQLSAPPGSMSAGVTIITSAGTIAGRVMISPPVDVSVVLVLYGNGGQIGEPLIFDPGSGGGTFSWPVGDDEGLSQSDAVGLLQKKICHK